MHYLPTLRLRVEFSRLVPCPGLVSNWVVQRRSADGNRHDDSPCYGSNSWGAGSKSDLAFVHYLERPLCRGWYLPYARIEGKTKEERKEKTWKGFFITPGHETGPCAWTEGVPGVGTSRSCPLPTHWWAHTAGLDIPVLYS